MARGRGAVTEHHHVFLSYSRNDSVATAADLYAQLRRHDLDVFKDDESIEPGDVWLDRRQSVLEGCGAFVVLVGRDGVRRWIGAETQVALNRHFAPHDDAERLPIFPILLDGGTVLRRRAGHLVEAVQKQKGGAGLEVRPEQGAGQARRRRGRKRRACRVSDPQALRRR